MSGERGETVNLCIINVWVLVSEYKYYGNVGLRFILSSLIALPFLVFKA